MYAASIKGCNGHNYITGRTHQERITNIRVKIDQLTHDIHAEQAAYTSLTLPFVAYFWWCTGFTIENLIGLCFFAWMCLCVVEFTCFFRDGRTNINKLLMLRLARKRWRQELVRVDNLDSV